MILPILLFGEIFVLMRRLYCTEQPIAVSILKCRYSSKVLIKLFQPTRVGRRLAAARQAR